MARAHIVAAAVVAALAGCGSGVFGLINFTCQGDEDCSGQEICDEGDCVECAGDIDCDADEFCNDSGDCQQIENEDEERDAGEDASACDFSAFDQLVGSIFASDGRLERDELDNVAGCAQPSDAFFIVFVVEAGSVTDADSDDVLWSDGGDPPQLCATAAAVFESIVMCPVCFDVAPDVLAVQLDNGTDVTNAVCVDTSGV